MKRIVTSLLLPLLLLANGCAPSDISFGSAPTVTATKVVPTIVTVTPSVPPAPAVTVTVTAPPVTVTVTPLPSPTPSATVTPQPATTRTLPSHSPKPVPTTQSPDSVIGATKSTEYISRKYEWEYRGSKWTWDLEIPQALYDYYKALPRTPTKNYSVYVTHPLQDPYIKKLIESIQEATNKKGFSAYETIEFAISFVQSLPYNTDLVTEGYDESPRYPAETLVDNGGDCEDTAILMAALIREMNYGVVLLRFSGDSGGSGHMAVGVAGGEGTYGTYWLYGGRKYYYLETTDNNWQIGEVPDEYKTARATVWDMTPVPILSNEWTGKWNSYYANIEVVVSNLGSADAKGVTVLAAFDAGNDRTWNRVISQPFDLGVNERITISLSPRVPSGEHTRIIVQIIYGGYSVDTSYSDWFDT